MSRDPIKITAERMAAERIDEVRPIVDGYIARNCVPAGDAALFPHCTDDGWSLGLAERGEPGYWALRTPALPHELMGMAQAYASELNRLLFGHDAFEALEIVTSSMGAGRVGA